MKRILTKEEWRRRRRMKAIIGMTAVILLMLTIIICSILFLIKVLGDNNKGKSSGKETITQTLSGGQVIKKEFLTPNPYSRPQKTLKQVKGIVVHYTANPGTTAENNHDYFEGLAYTKTTSVSSHFIIGLEGEIIQCIPLTEIAYASNERNKDTISIECCHPDETGKFNDETYESLVALTAALCHEYHLEEEDIIRHYDITQKLCPLYFVEHEDAWISFKAEVMEEVIRLENEEGSMEIATD